MSVLQQPKMIAGLAAMLLVLALALAYAASGAGPLPGDVLLTRAIQTVLPPGDALFGVSVWLGKLLTYLPFIALGVALLARKWEAALVLALVSLIAVYLLEDQLKIWFPRARPSNTLVSVYQSLKSTSFPSGTAFRSMAVLGTSWLFCLQAWPGQPVVRWLMTSCVLLLWLMGLMRVWLGVHWTSDILGGWLFGGALVLFMWALYQFIRPHLIRQSRGNA
jgi:membrane-associated phospholipid phosphatase